jgi:mTERF domain-containing protein
MMAIMIWKLMITNQFTLSKAMPSLAFPFTVKSHITLPNFCTQTTAPSITPQTGVVTQFLLNKCGLTREEIAKAFRHCNNFLQAKSSQNLEEVLELLNGCGLTTPAQIRRVVLSSPKFLFANAERNVQSKLTLFGTFMKEEHICKLLIAYAKIFEYSEDKLNSAISLLQRLGFNGQELAELVARVPRLLTISEEKVLESFKILEDFEYQKGSKIFPLALLSILGAGKENIDRRLRCLSSLGFSEKQVSQISRRKPTILALSEEKLKRHVDFLVNSVGLPLDDVAKYVCLFTCSLEKRIIPRYRVMEALKSMQVLKTGMSFPNIINLSERHFLEKYVNSNAESFSVLSDIYHGGKAGKFVRDKEACNEPVSVKMKAPLCNISMASLAQEK